MRENVWKSVGEDLMSQSAYILSISLFTAFGILVSFFVSSFTTHMEIGWAEVILILILGIAGVTINSFSRNPFVSLFGYMMVAVPYGALLGPFLNELAGPLANKYLGIPMNSNIVLALFATTIYVILFGVIGAMIPKNLYRWASWILAALLVVLVGYFVIPIAGIFGLPATQMLGFWDWFVVGLFAVIIVYDMNRAMHIPFTLDNSIDVALNIYLDWFNVFIRIAEFLSGRVKD